MAFDPTDNNKLGFPGEATLLPQGIVLKGISADLLGGEQLPGGVCWEACRQWLGRRAGRRWNDSTLFDIFGMEGDIIPKPTQATVDLIRAHKDHSSYSESDHLATYLATYLRSKALPLET